MEAVLNSPFGPIILEHTVVTIGSASDNRLVVSNYTVSSHHAEIRPEERGYSIIDLGSAYGTFVNDQRLDWNVPYLLNSEDTILVGNARFTYVLRETAQEAMIADTTPRTSLPTFYEQAQTPLPLQDSPPARTAYGLDLPEAYQQPTYPVASSLERIPLYVPQPGTMTGIPAEDGGAINQPLQKRSRRKLWIPVGIVVVLLVASALAYFFVIRSTPDKTLDAFCNSMQKGDYKGAYNQFSPSLQKTESEPQFESENKGTSCTHDSATQSGGSAQANLTTVASSGTKSSGQVTLVQDSNNNWKINTLPSTPSATVDAFCNGIKTGDYQTVYNQLSSRVQGQDSESEFASSLAQSGIAACTHGDIVVSQNTATGSIMFYSSTGQTAQYIVTLVKEGSTWKIDDITSS